MASHRVKVLVIEKSERSKRIAEEACTGSLELMLTIQLFLWAVKGIWGDSVLRGRTERKMGMDHHSSSSMMTPSCLEFVPGVIVHVVMVEVVNVVP